MEWYEILIAILVFGPIVWLKDEIENRRLEEYILKEVMYLWLTGQGPPNLYVPPRSNKTKTTE